MGLVPTSQVKVIVTAAANTPPIANAGPNQQITAPANSVTLNGLGSIDPDGTITTYKLGDHFRTRISYYQQFQYGNAIGCRTSGWWIYSRTYSNR